MRFVYRESFTVIYSYRFDQICIMPQNNHIKNSPIISTIQTPQKLFYWELHFFLDKDISKVLLMGVGGEDDKATSDWRLGDWD